MTMLNHDLHLLIFRNVSSLDEYSKGFTLETKKREGIKQRAARKKRARSKKYGMPKGIQKALTRNKNMLKMNAY